jgi:superfamily II DNA or RNA helicase
MNISIQFTPIKSRILTPLPEHINLGLYNLLSFKGEGYFFMPRFQNGQWDGVTRLYNPEKQTFRSGFLFTIVDFLYKNQFNVDVENYPSPLEFTQHSNTYKLRPYQLDLVKSILTYRFGVIEAPPRTGKTIISGAVLDSTREFPAIFYCRSIDLAAQTYRVFALGDPAKNILPILPDLKIGMVGDGHFELGDVTIVTIQSAYSAYGEKFVDKVDHKEKDVDDKGSLRKLISNAKVIFYDEAHESSGRTSRYILDKSKDVGLRIGLTATPEEGKPEDIKLTEHLGSVIHKVGYSELIKEGYLLKPVIYMYKLPKMTIEGTYLQVYKAAVTDNIFLNHLLKRIVKTLNDLGHSVVIQTEYRNHTEKLASFLEAPFLMGKESGEKRGKVLQDLRDKKIMCLVSTIVEQGIDVPSLSYTINLCGQKSKIATIQRMRSMTVHEGKATCGIIDFVYQCIYLKDHSKLRLKVYKSEPEFEVHMRDVSKKTIQDFM